MHQIFYAFSMTPFSSTPYFLFYRLSTLPSLSSLPSIPSLPSPISLLSSLLIYLFIRDERSFDAFHEKKAQI